MLKEFFYKILLIIYAILIFLTGCTFSLKEHTLYLNIGNTIFINSYYTHPVDCNVSIIDRTSDELINRYGTPELINQHTYEYYNTQGEHQPIISICYRNDKRKLFGKEPAEYCYIGFDTKTGLADVVICPWYLPTE